MHKLMEMTKKNESLNESRLTAKSSVNFAVGRVIDSPADRKTLLSDLFWIVTGSMDYVTSSSTPGSRFTWDSARIDHQKPMLALLVFQ